MIGSGQWQGNWRQLPQVGWQSICERFHAFSASTTNHARSTCIDYGVEAQRLARELESGELRDDTTRELFMGWLFGLIVLLDKDDITTSDVTALV